MPKDGKTLLPIRDHTPETNILVTAAFKQVNKKRSKWFKKSCIPDSTHQVQPTCQRPRYSSAGSKPGKQFLKSGQGRFSREPLLPPCQEKLMHPNVFLFQMRTHLPKMMNCSIISAREELQIILIKSDLKS